VRGLVSALIVALGVHSALVVAAQTPKTDRARAQAAVPRTSDGHPDLQGLWDYRTATPLERPRDIADKEFFTDQEAAAFEKRTAERRDNVVAVHPPAWLDYGSKVLSDRRTSLIVDPANGRIPALTAAARARMAATNPANERDADGPEQRSIQERCLVFGAGPPLVPGPYNNNVQIVQSPGYIMLLSEMIHTARIVRMDASPHGTMRRWYGDSRGHWEGDTLVVDTVNFNGRLNFRGSGENLHLIERFTRTGPSSLQYEFTVDDPTMWTKSWTAMVPMIKSEEPIYEYACHEGNYAMAGILAGARAAEKAAAETKGRAK